MSNPVPELSRPRNASIAFILVTILIDTLGLGVIIPVFPSLVVGLLGNDLSTASRYYGAFAAVYAAMQVVFAPILGGLSDRFGRRPVLLLSLFGAGFSYVLLALAPNLAWLFVGRVIAGITGASFSAATSYIADITPADKRAQSFGLMGAMFGLGFIIGPVVGGLLGSVHPRLPFAAAAALNFLNLLYGLFVLPESLRREDRRPFSFRKSNPLGSLGGLRSHPIVLGLTGTFICAFMAQNILQSCWALYGQSRFGWRELDVGLSLAAVGAASALVQGGLIRLVMPRLGERRALLLGTAINAAGLIAIGFATQGWMMYAIIMPFALGGIAGPAAQALISREVGPSEQGQVQGSLASLQSLTSIFSPILGTALFARFSPEAAVPHIPGAPFFAAAFITVVGLLLALRLLAAPPVPVAVPKAE